MSAELVTSSWGKDGVRVLRVVRGAGGRHEVAEYNVQVLLEGAADASFTQGDNSPIVATDSIKNIVYYLAKVSPHVLRPELFGLHIGTFFVAKYGHVKRARVGVEQARWTRMGGEGHLHSFLRDGDEKRVVKAVVEEGAGEKGLVGSVTSGIADLIVLKSTGSGFSGFLRDEFTLLPEVQDRILSTAVDVTWAFAPLSIPLPTDAKGVEFFDGGAATGGVWAAGEVAGAVRRATLEVFGGDESVSVQSTLWKVCARVVGERDEVEWIRVTMPNRHYIPVNMEYLGIENVTPLSAEVFTPTSEPSGLISATVKRGNV